MNNNHIYNKKIEDKMPNISLCPINNAHIHTTYLDDKFLNLIDEIDNLDNKPTTYKPSYDGLENNNIQLFKEISEIEKELESFNKLNILPVQTNSTEIFKPIRKNPKIFNNFTKNEQWRS